MRASQNQGTVFKLAQHLSRRKRSRGIQSHHAGMKLGELYEQFYLDVLQAEIQSLGSEEKSVYLRNFESNSNLC